VKTVAAIAVAGSLALARYGLEGFVSRRQSGAFPWGTFVVNVSGAFALGRAAANVVGSCAAGLVAVYLGVVLARAL
jgi:CrcB protein